VRARRFRPVPSIVLRFGGSSDRLLLWGLDEPVSVFELAARNERLSYALRAPRTRCDAGGLRVPLPGTFLRLGRQRPAPVLVTRMDAASYSLAEVSGRLKDPPSRDAWRERA
jgi:hypothetical protein